jgi:hypothetical protein
MGGWSDVSWSGRQPVRARQEACGAFLSGCAAALGWGCSSIDGLRANFVEDGAAFSGHLPLRGTILLPVDDMSFVFDPLAGGEIVSLVPLGEEWRERAYRGGRVEVGLPTYEIRQGGSTLCLSSIPRLLLLVRSWFVPSLQFSDDPSLWLRDEESLSFFGDDRSVRPLRGEVMRVVAPRCPSTLEAQVDVACHFVGRQRARSDAA